MDYPSEHIKNNLNKTIPKEIYNYKPNGKGDLRRLHKRWKYKK